MRYTVKYYAGAYSGKRVVFAEDEEEAIEKVRRQIRKEMSIPMYSDGYEVIGSEEETEE